LAALAYWYDGGRPSGCWGFMASEVDDALADCCDETGAVAAAGGLVPLVLGGGLGGARVEVEAVEWRGALAEAEVLCEATDWLLLLRVEPTNLRKRWFMDDIDPQTYSCRDQDLMASGANGCSQYWCKSGKAYDAQRR